MNDLGKLTEYLLTTIAELIVAPIAEAGASHAAIRAKLDEYQAGAAGALVTSGTLALAGEAHAVTVDAVRNRYVDWLGNPRLKHGPWIKEARGVDVSLQEAVAGLLEGVTPTKLLKLWAAIVRATSMTQAMGEACIYTEPKRPRAKSASGARRGPKGRARVMKLSDVPQDLHGLVERIGYGDDADRDTAIGELEALRGTDLDSGAIVTKLVTLVRDGANGTINRLGAEIRKGRTGQQTVEASPMVSAAPGVPVAQLGGSMSAAIGAAAADEESVGSMPSPRAPAVDDAAVRKAEALLGGFVQRYDWALTEAGGRITLAASKKDIVEAFAIIDGQPDGQARLRAMMVSSK